jgi:hypothetical protein
MGAGHSRVAAHESDVRSALPFARLARVSLGVAEVVFGFLVPAHVSLSLVSNLSVSRLGPCQRLMVRRSLGWRGWVMPAPQTSEAHEALMWRPPASGKQARPRRSSILFLFFLEKRNNAATPHEAFPLSHGWCTPTAQGSTHTHDARHLPRPRLAAAAPGRVFLPPDARLWRPQLRAPLV